MVESHKTKLQLFFKHNHPLKSAHVLSFRPIDEETRMKYFKLFQSGHCAASARHYYETTLMDMNEGNELQIKMSDRAIKPTISDVNRLYNQWQLSEYGPERYNKNLSELLVEEIRMYNVSNAVAGGKANVQIFEACTDEVAVSQDSDINCSIS